MNDTNRLMQGGPASGVFGDHFDDLFQGFFRPVVRSASDGNQAQPAAIDIYEKDGRYLVKAELPGVDKKDRNNS